MSEPKPNPAGHAPSPPQLGPGAPPSVRLITCLLVVDTGAAWHHAGALARQNCDEVHVLQRQLGEGGECFSHRVASHLRAGRFSVLTVAAGTARTPLDVLAMLPAGLTDETGVRLPRLVRLHFQLDGAPLPRWVATAAEALLQRRVQVELRFDSGSLDARPLRISASHPLARTGQREPSSAVPGQHRQPPFGGHRPAATSVVSEFVAVRGPRRRVVGEA